jgi:hypothetical protein
MRPASAHARMSAPNSACVPGAGCRPGPGVQPQPTSESSAMCRTSAAMSLPPLRAGSLICAQISASVFPSQAAGGTRMLAHHREAPGERILPGRLQQFVDEALDRVVGVRVADRTPPQRRRLRGSRQLGCLTRDRAVTPSLSPVTLGWATAIGRASAHPRSAPRGIAPVLRLRATPPPSPPPIELQPGGCHLSPRQGDSARRAVTVRVSRVTREAAMKAVIVVLAITAVGILSVESACSADHRHPIGLSSILQWLVVPGAALWTARRVLMNTN